MLVEEIPCFGEKVGQWAPQIRWLALPRRDRRRYRSLRPAAW